MSFWRLEVFADLPSTSDYCIEKARAGEPAGLAVMARRQTAGRGSRGRLWLAPDGNLNLSVLLRPAIPAAHAGCFALMAGIATAQAVPLPTMLKWPNDVMLNGAKLAGILIDAAPSGPHIDWLVIGIGINIASAPDIADRPATSLREHGAALTADDAAAAVLQQLSDMMQQPLPSIIQTWLSLAHPLGTPLVVNGSIRGQFAGLSPAGQLLLATPTGIETFNTGDILLGQIGRERQGHAAGG